MAKSTFFKDFKAFIAKGNVLDMAVGVVIGAAFGKIVTSLVNDIITPLIALIIGKGSLDTLVITLKEATETTTAITLNIGTFVSTIIDFLVVSLCIFTVLRALIKIKNLAKKDEVKEAGATTEQKK
jgi:large conductance mechanosensitive channel